MTESEKIENIIAFLAIILGNEPFISPGMGSFSEIHRKLMDLSPEYLIEKFERYIRCDEAQESCGLHPVLKASFIDPYMKKWKLKGK